MLQVGDGDAFRAAREHSLLAVYSFGSGGGPAPGRGGPAGNR